MAEWFGCVSYGPQLVPGLTTNLAGLLLHVILLLSPHYLSLSTVLFNKDKSPPKNNNNKKKELKYTRICTQIFSWPTISNTTMVY